MNITQDYIHTLHIYRYHRQITTESKYKVKGTDRRLALSDG